MTPIRVCRYWRPDLGASLGIVLDGRVYDLAVVDPKRFATLADLIAADDPGGVLENASRAATKLVGISWEELDAAPDASRPHLLAPATDQEIWAAGVTYLRSRDARIDESAGGGSFYDKVYTAERPELFLKAAPGRAVGPNAPIRIRADSRWNVPEPELALVISPRARLVGFTIGNDCSSRDIEGENPLYLPQAKVYRGSCALGPAMIASAAVPDPRRLTITMVIRRRGAAAFEGSTSIAQMKRSFDDLIRYLYLEQDFPAGAILLTGTGIVPPDDFTLQRGDVVEITVPEIGTLRNPVA